MNDTPTVTTASSSTATDPTQLAWDVLAAAAFALAAGLRASATIAPTVDALEVVNKVLTKMNCASRLEPSH
jgi:hypothetical protein